MKINENFSLESIIQILDNQNSLIYIIGYDDDKVVYANKSATKKSSNILNKKIKDVLNLSENNELFLILTNQQKYFDYKERTKNPSKGIIQIYNNNEFYSYETFGIINNNKKYKILILTDITTIQTNLNYVEKKNKLLETIIDESPVAIWYMDNNLNYSLSNSFLKNNMMNGNKWIINEDETTIAHNHDIEVLKKINYSINYESLTFKDGRTHQLKNIRKRIFDNEGKKMGVIGIGIDITEIKSTEDKFRYLKELNELISEYSSKLIHCKVNAIDDYIKETLKALSTFVGADRVYVGELNNENREITISFEHYRAEIIERPNMIDFNYSNITRWIDLLNYNNYLLIPDVKQIPLKYNNEKLMLEKSGLKSMLAFPLLYNSELIGFVSFDNLINVRYWDKDIIFLLRIATEIIAGSMARKKFELRIIEAMNAAEVASRTKSEFLANMSHEIGTPMNAILGFSEILKESITSGVQKSYLNTIINSGKNLMKLINDILDLSKIEAGRIDIMPEPVDLIRIFGEIEKIFEIKIKDKNLDFIIDIDKKVEGYWLFDETRLRQILFNIVGNAIKFTEKGFISISAKLILDSKSNQKNIEISIKDSGIGIPEEHQKRIFDSFYQVYTKTGKKYDGTGLGLAITMRLIRAMNGEIYLNSKPDIGTTLTIIFKDVRPAEITIAKEEEIPEVSIELSFNNARFLVVDDIQDNRELIKYFIEEYNGIVIEANNGEDAIKLASFYKPSAIILDIRMPRMSGFEVLKHIRFDERTKDIPVVALTAVSSAFQEKHLYKEFDSVLTKPVRKDDLLNKLSSLVL